MNDYYSDLTLDLRVSQDGDIAKDVGVDAIKNSLKNIFLTLQGSRRMLPTFAMNLHYLLFDPLDEITARQIGEEISTVLSNWEDRIIVDKLYVIPKYDQNQYKIKLFFKVKNSEHTEDIEYILDKF